jgi:hypothetical protein
MRELAEKFGLNFIKVTQGSPLFGEAVRSGSIITIALLLNMETTMKMKLCQDNPQSGGGFL